MVGGAEGGTGIFHWLASGYFLTVKEVEAVEMIAKVTKVLRYSTKISFSRKNTISKGDKFEDQTAGI